MIFIPFFALALGFLIASLLSFGPVVNEVGMYLAVSSLAGIDTFLGGIRSAQEGKFATDVFVSGFVVNVLIASFLAWLGDHIGVNLVLVSAIVFGMRIFTNLSLIRRYLVTRWRDEMERRKERQAAATAATPTQTTP